MRSFGCVLGVSRALSHLTLAVKPCGSPDGVPFSDERAKAQRHVGFTESHTAGLDGVWAWFSQPSTPSTPTVGSSSMHGGATNWAILDPDPRTHKIPSDTCLLGI